MGREANTGSCTADREAYAQGANVAGIDSGNPGNWTFEYAHSGDGDSDGHRAAQPMPTVRFTTEYNAVGGTQPYNGLGTQAYLCRRCRSPPVPPPQASRLPAEWGSRRRGIAAIGTALSRAGGITEPHATPGLNR